MADELPDLAERVSALTASAALLEEKWRALSPLTGRPAAELAVLAGETKLLASEVGKLESAVREAAAAAGAAVPDEPLSLAQTSAILDALRAERERRRHEERRTAAVAVLDRVMMLGHADEAAFEPLVKCQAKAAVLRRQMADGGASEATEAILAGRHPFCVLLDTIGRLHRLSDDEWSGLLESLTAAFGRNLAVAILRGRIVSGAPAPAATPEPPQAEPKRPPPPEEPHAVAAEPVLPDELAREIDLTRAAIEDAAASGLARDAERTHWLGLIAAASIRVPAAEVSAALRDVREQLASRRSEIFHEIRQGLLADRLHPGAARAQALLDAGDLAGARECLDAIRSGAARPEPRDAFRDFFPTRLEALEQFLQGDGAGPSAIRRVRGRRPFCGIDTSELTPDMAEATASMLEAWFAAKRRQSIEPAALDSILAGLGFSIAAPARVIAARRRPLYAVTTAPVRGPRDCACPEFGSAAAGQYRVLCTWDRPAEAEIVSEATEAGEGLPLLVLHFGLVPAGRRRELARLCVAKRLAVLVLDDALLLHLCGYGEDRLAKLFDCGLPFAGVSPYRDGAAPEIFQGRETEIGLVCDPTGPPFVCGAPGSGKSMLLREAASRFDRSSGQVSVYADLAAAGSPARALAAAGIPDVPAWLNSHRSRKLLVLVDHAGPWLSAEPEAGAAWLTLAEKSGGRVRFVYAGTHEVFRFARMRGLPVLTVGPLLDENGWRHARTLVERPFGAAGWRFASADLVTRILGQCNYQPEAIRLYCHSIHTNLASRATAAFDSQTSPPYVLRSKHLPDVADVPEVRDLLRRRLREALALDPRYRRVAQRLTEALDENPPGDGVPLDRLVADMQARWTDSGGEGTLRGLIDEMAALGLLVEWQPGWYALRDPLTARGLLREKGKS